MKNKTLAVAGALAVWGGAGWGGAGWGGTECQAGVVVLQEHVRVGSGSMSYRDPEFLRQATAAGEVGRVAWYDQNRAIRVGEIDAVSGQIVSPLGQQVGVGSAFTTTPQELGSYNGPEWGVDRDGAGVYFSAYDGAGKMQVARHKGGVTSFVTAGGDSPTAVFDRGGNLASQNFLASETRLFYFLQNVNSGELAVRVDGQPASERRLTIAAVDTSGPRWLPDGRTLVINPLVAGTAQLALLDTAVPGSTPVVITSDAGNKSDAFFWRAPDRGNDLIGFASVSGIGAGGRDALGIYERDELGAWGRTGVLDVAALAGIPEGGRFFSAEPMVLGGRSFITLSVSSGEIFATPSSVWLVSLDGEVVRQVSAEAAGFYVDPEALVLGDRAHIYYYTQPFSTGGLAELYVTTVAVPEPGAGAVALAALLLGGRRGVGGRRMIG